MDIGHGPISAVMSYTTLGWGSIGGIFIMHVYVAMILLSSKPVICELPLPYPDLVFTREQGGNSYHRYRWWLCLDGYSCSDGDHAQTMIIGSNDYVLDFCQWLMHMEFCWWLSGSQIYFLSSWLAYLEVHSSLWSWHSQHIQKMLNSIRCSRSLDPVQWEIYMVLGSYMRGSYDKPLTWWYSYGS